MATVPCPLPNGGGLPAAANPAGGETAHGAVHGIRSHAIGRIHGHLGAGHPGPGFKTGFASIPAEPAPLDSGCIKRAAPVGRPPVTTASLVPLGPKVLAVAAGAGLLAGGGAYGYGGGSVGHGGGGIPGGGGGGGGTGPGGGGGGGTTPPGGTPPGGGGTPVPEPATIALFGMALLCLAMVRYRRRPKT